MPELLKIDVSASVPAGISGGQEQWIAGWVFKPSAPAAQKPVPVVACFPGATYDKRYYHMQIEGRPDYSMAEFLAERGAVVVALDNYGIGESARPADPAKVDREVVAAIHHAAASRIFERASAGTLAQGLPPLADILRVGIGHSMGAMLTVAQQAGWSSYDRVVMLGYSAIGAHYDTSRPAKMLWEDEHYRLMDRSSRRSSFHWSDVPDDVIAADEATNVAVLSALALQAIVKDVVKEDSARITVPVFIGLGENDVSANPRAEPSYFTSSNDITLHILPKSGHCHNFAGTRLSLWQQISDWIHSGIEPA